MLFTNISEIRNILPTAKWNDLNKLASLLEEEEQNNLLHILGTSLYHKLQEDYDSIVAVTGDITPTAISNASSSQASESPSDDSTSESPVQDDSSDEPSSLPQSEESDDSQENSSLNSELIPFKLSVLRTCQRITFYMVLAHNSGLFSLSFNEGGGVNSSTADNYDEANEKAVQRFVKDAYNKANRNIDSLLRLLELDAQGERIYTAEWKESRYFYRQAGLLFTTAVSLQEFLNIDESRERYIQLVPRIRYAQSTYIRPRLGSKLLTDLIALKYNPSPSPVNDGSPVASPSDHSSRNNVIPSSRNDEAEQTSSTLGESEGASQLSILLPTVLSSLALYVESSEKTMARPLSFNEGEMQIAIARQYIKQHPEEFADYYCPELADILPPPTPVNDGSPVEPQPAQHPHHHVEQQTVNGKLPNGKCPHGKCDDPYVLDLGGLTHS